MSAAARFTQADVQRALKAARKSGYSEARVRIDVDGCLEVIVGMTAIESRPPPRMV